MSEDRLLDKRDIEELEILHNEYLGWDKRVLAAQDAQSVKLERKAIAQLITNALPSFQRLMKLVEKLRRGERPE